MIFISALVCIVFFVVWANYKLREKDSSVASHIPRLLEVEKASVREALAKENLEIIGNLKFPDDAKSYIGKQYIVIINGVVEERGTITDLIEERVYPHSAMFSHVLYSSINDNGEECKVIIELYDESPYYEICESDLA